jgi:Leucine-rich repeat (LRR) protein
MDILRKLELKQLTDEEIKQITTLDLSNNNITKIPECIEQLANLQSLNLSNNNLSNIPKCIGQLTNLRTLFLKWNKITTISEYVGQFTNLLELNLYGNRITTIPECFGQLTNLQKLDLGGNRIIIIPECIGKLTNLQLLGLEDNQISTIPVFIGLLTNLRILVLEQNEITTISNCIGQLANLHTLNLDHNLITTISECVGHLANLHTLNLSHNLITIISDCVGQLINLHTLNLSHNLITTIPAILGRLTICKFYWSNNQIEYIPPNVKRLLNEQKIQRNIYNDTQNVHDHNIQESIRQSIYSILNDKCSNKDFIEEILHSSLQIKTKQFLTEYCNDVTVHSLNITFSELLKYVWNRITKHKHKDDILKILDEEMENAECKCFTGRISRLVNVLNGYYDDINIKISDNSQIGTIISIIKQNYIGNNIDELKEIIRKELIERNIDVKVIKEWIEYVDI